MASGRSVRAGLSIRPVWIALDTNILAYAEGVQHGQADAPKVAASRGLLESMLQDLACTAVAPAPTLAELYHVLTRKAGRSPEQARAAIERIMDTIEVAPVAAPVLRAALELAAKHHLQIFDAVIIAASAAAGCEVLISEDLQDGSHPCAVTVTNPFGANPHPVIGALRRS